MHNEQNVTVTVNVSPAATVVAGPPMKKAGVGVLLAIFLGGFGAHRFYLNRPLAPVMFGVGLVGALTFPVTQVPLQLVTVIWGFIDVVSISEWVREANAKALAGEPVETPMTLSDGLEIRLLRAAEARGGKITVTQGVMDTSASFDDVHECLNGMVEEGYADVGNAPDSGVVVYTFGEL